MLEAMIDIAHMLWEEGEMMEDEEAVGIQLILTEMAIVWYATTI